jgi:hypothetical protein
MTLLFRELVFIQKSGCRIIKPFPVKCEMHLNQHGRKNVLLNFLFINFKYNGNE